MGFNMYHIFTVWCILYTASHELFFFHWT